MISPENSVSNEKFKKLFYHLWNIFPNSLTREEVEDVIKMEETRKRLDTHGFLFIEPQNNAKGEKENFYGLGPNGITLISTWETEKITKYALWVSHAAFIVSLVALAVSLIR